jgi:hypothetical protein
MPANYQLIGRNHAGRTVIIRGVCEIFIVGTDAPSAFVTAAHRPWTEARQSLVTFPRNGLTDQKGRSQWKWTGKWEGEGK